MRRLLRHGRIALRDGVWLPALLSAEHQQDVLGHPLEAADLPIADQDLPRTQAPLKYFLNNIRRTVVQEPFDTAGV